MKRQTYAPTNKRPVKKYKPKPQSFSRQIGAAAPYRPAPEKKNIDIGTALLSLSRVLGTWQINLINGITQGTTANQRVGRKITLESVMVRFYAIASTGNGIAPNIRWMLVYDREPDGSVPLPAPTILTEDSINGVNNIVEGDRFMILHDEYQQRADSGCSTYEPAGKFFKKFSPPLEMTYDNVATGTIADISKGALYIMACTIADAHATATQFRYLSRVRYTDV